MAALLVGHLLGCISLPQTAAEGTPREQLARIESLFADLRDLHFQREVALASGRATATNGTPIAGLSGAEAALRERALERLAALDPGAFRGEDARAIGRMRRVLEGSRPAVAVDPLDCARPLPADDGLAEGRADRLRRWASACFAARAGAIETSLGIADQRTLVDRIAEQPSAADRRRDFLALMPLWRTVNGNNSPDSPYRSLMTDHRRSGGAADLTHELLRSLGLSTAGVEAMLEHLLAAWATTLPDSLVEPWDWLYANGAAVRTLNGAFAHRSMLSINEAAFAAIGASPLRLRIRYDIAARPDKPAVTLTQFGGVPRRTATGPVGAEPVVVASFVTANFRRLGELLRETGHAVHLAAIEARPAFADWPESAPFVEGVADVLAWEAFDAEWQRRHLALSAPDGDNRRAWLAPVAMDLALALFEQRMMRDPAQDPNQLWSDITSRYLKIAGHSEWSWWAMRGQILASPGSMLSTALGAVVTADLRDRLQRRPGPRWSANPVTYDWLSDALFRFGAGSSAQHVLEGALGRPLSAEPLRRLLSAQP